MNEQLLKATCNGNVDEVRRLVREDGADPNAVDNYGMNALHHASRKGHLSVSQYLVSEAHVDVNRASDRDGYTPLHFAYGCLPVARYLVESCGANVDAQPNLGHKPLHFASGYGHLDVVKYLVGKRGANVNAKNYWVITPLDKAVEHGKEDVIRYLLPRTSSVATETLTSLWKLDHLLEFRGMLALEKYAAGRGLGNAFSRCPIHALLLHFPLPSVRAFLDCIDLFPASKLSLLDEHGRLCIHVALHARNSTAKSPSVIASLFEREPRLAIARDPTTGLYPHETAAGLASHDDDNDDDDDDDGWLDITFKMFRSNPQHLLQSRDWLERYASSASDEKESLQEGPLAKKAKVEQRVSSVK